MSQKIFEKLTDRYSTLPEDERLKFKKKQKVTSLDDIKVRVLFIKLSQKLNILFYLIH